MKKSVRIISIVMVIAMMFSMATSAFADRVAIGGGGGTTISSGTNVAGRGGSSSGSSSGGSISANTKPSYYTTDTGKTTTELTVEGTAEAPQYLGNGDIDYDALTNSSDVNIANNADFIMYVHDNMDTLDEGTVNTALAIFGEEVISGEAIEEAETKNGDDDCEHEWVEANCTAPKTCSKCGKTEGTALGHNFQINSDNHTVCARCGILKCSLEEYGHVGAQGADGNLYCDYCGTLLTPETVASASAETATVTETTTETQTEAASTAEGVVIESVTETETEIEEPAVDTETKTEEPVVEAETNTKESVVETENTESAQSVETAATKKVIHAEAISYTGTTPETSFSNVCPGHSSLISALGATKLTFVKPFDIVNSTDYRITINMQGTEVVSPAGEYAFVIRKGEGNYANATSITFTNGSVTGDNGFWVENGGVLNLGGYVNTYDDILVKVTYEAVHVENGGTAVAAQGSQLYSTGYYGVEIEAGGQFRQSGGTVATKGSNANAAIWNKGTYLLNSTGYDLNSSYGVVRNDNGVAVWSDAGSSTIVGAGTIIGQTGIAVQGAGSKVQVYGGTITGTGAYSTNWQNTGSAILVYSTDPIVTVSGGALRSEKSAAIMELSDASTRVTKDTVTNITLFDGSLITQQASGMYSDYKVAKYTVNDVGYASLTEAVAAANASTDTTVTLKMGGDDDITSAVSLNPVSHVIFDGNGYELSATGCNAFEITGGNVTIQNITISGDLTCSGVYNNGGTVTVGNGSTIRKCVYGVSTSSGSTYINDVYMPDSVDTGVNCEGGYTEIDMITDDCDTPVRVKDGNTELLSIRGGWFKRDIKKNSTSALDKVSTYIDEAQSHLKYVDKDKYYEVFYNDEPTVTLISPASATTVDGKTYIVFDKNIYEANAEPLIFQFDAGCVQVDAVSYNAAKTVYPLFTSDYKDSKGNLVGATGNVRIADRSILKDLPAGAYDLQFTFANGATITDKLVLSVYPAAFLVFKVPNSFKMSTFDAATVKEYCTDDYLITKTGYDILDQENFLVIMSELPEKIAIGSNSYPYGDDVNQKTYLEYYLDPTTVYQIPDNITDYGGYAAGNYAYFVSYADLNNLVPGENYIFADYGDTLYEIEKATDIYASVYESFDVRNGNVYISPTSVDWSSLSGIAYFTVVPDVLNYQSANAESVFIDGECVDHAYWTFDPDTHTLGIKTEYLKELPKETHSLEILTNAGKLGAKIKTNAGLAPKNLDYHVYGGAKSLSFVASDKIDKDKGIYIGSSNPTLLDSSCYVWDSDYGFTLSAAFLNRLALGTYYVSAYVWDGTDYTYRTTSFRVISASQASYNPSTGDDSNIFIWLAVLVLSAVAIVVIVLPRLKKTAVAEGTQAEATQRKPKHSK